MINSNTCQKILLLTDLDSTTFFFFKCTFFNLSFIRLKLKINTIFIVVFNQYMYMTESGIFIPTTTQICKELRIRLIINNFIHLQSENLNFVLFDHSKISQAEVI